MTGPVSAALGPVAILAGSGDLPALVADRLRRDGREHRILAFRGFAEKALRARADAVVDLLDIKGSLDWLDRWGPGCVTLAGGVSRPGPGAILSAFSAVRNRREIAAVIARGDDQVLRGVLDILEERGHRLVGVHELAPELMAQPGLYGAHAPSGEDRLAIGVGMRVLAALSGFDIGQAAVVAGERVLAIEGPEGTDRMVARSKPRWRMSFGARPAARGTLIKLAKTGQDIRVDLPAIGPRTVARAAQAGLAGIAIGAGCTLVLGREATVAAADRLGLFLIGMPESGEPEA